jgi:hypothetical protein
MVGRARALTRLSTHEPQERGAGHDDATSDLDARKLATTQGLVASAREMPSMVAAVSTP